MDHEWFKEVNKRLTEIEDQKAKRYALAPGQIDREVHLHPSISSSVYWHRGDALVPSKCFDYRMSHFPRQYVRYVGRESRTTVDLMAMRPYRNDTGDTVTQENSKTLIARIILLKLNHLLPEF